jgi:hypothetical protein
VALGDDKHFVVWTADRVFIESTARFASMVYFARVFLKNQVFDTSHSQAIYPVACFSGK